MINQDSIRAEEEENIYGEFNEDQFKSLLKVFEKLSSLEIDLQHH